MNSTLTPSANPPVASAADNDNIDLGRYVDILLAHKWLIAAITLIVLAGGVFYAATAKPVYQSSIVIQIEDIPEGGGTRGVLAGGGNFFEVKTPASAEMEIIRSRMIVGKAVEASKLYISAVPRYVPYIGGWLARRSSGLSDPGFLGFEGYVSGRERISVTDFEVPEALEGSSFLLTAKSGGQYTLQHPGWTTTLSGTVGTPLKAEVPGGRIQLLVAELASKPGGQFNVTRMSTQSTISAVSDALALSERGRASSIVNVSMQDTDPYKLVQVLNAVGQQYVRQNVERRSAEAQKTLVFLDSHLPEYKQQLETAEDNYNRFRNRRGMVAFDQESAAILNQAVDRQSKLFEAQQRRRELEARFTPNHPLLQTLDAQIAALNRDLADVQARIKGLPELQQEAVRFERDVKVNTELYQSMVNSALQLRLVKEGKVGNVRVLDEAIVPTSPIKPDRRNIIAAALMLGLFAGVLAAFVRNAFVEQRLRDPHEVEANTSLPVFSTIPVSAAQQSISQRRLSGATGMRLLAIEQPEDPAVESLRSLRTAMQFAMLESPNNRVMITGPTPGVGKSFVTANFAALMAAAGKRTLLIDADLRRGHIHQYLGLQRHGGLSELIAGSLTIQQTVHRQVAPNLDLLATGQLPPNPAELLVSDSFRSTMERLSEQYDLVVIDTPPVLVASDAATVAAHAGTVLLVARANLSTMGELKESTRRLALGGKAATGVLLNGMDLEKRAYSAYKYGRYRYTNYNYESILPEEQ